LLTEGKVLQSQILAGAEQRAQEPEEGDEHGGTAGFCPGLSRPRATDTILARHRQYREFTVPLTLVLVAWATWLFYKERKGSERSDQRPSVTLPLSLCTVFFLQSSLMRQYREYTVPLTLLMAGWSILNFIRRKAAR
jgi:hypothetical protein